MVLVSRYEAEKLYDVATSEHVQLRMYAPRQNQSYAPMGLDLFCVGKASSKHPIEPDLMTQLNLFAGQCYFDSYREYVDTCDYLNLSWGGEADDRAGAAGDGFVEPRRRVQRRAGRTNFEESPVPFLRALLARVRCGGDVGSDKTHVGRMLNGVVLTEDDFAPRAKRMAEGEPAWGEEPSLFVRGGS